MDGMIVLVLVVTLLATLGAAAATLGADSRDGFRAGPGRRH